MALEQNTIYEKISSGLFSLFMLAVFACIFGPSAYQLFIVGANTYVSAETSGYGGGGGGGTTDTTAFSHGHFLADPPYELKRYLGAGDEGVDVFSIQIILIHLGFFDTAVPVSGYYGPATAAAVKLYQQSYSVEPTGNIGPQTRELLNKEPHGQTWVNDAPVNAAFLRLSISDLLKEASKVLKVPLRVFHY